MSVQIAISIGDNNGIGPEVVLKSLSQTDLSGITPVVLSSRSVIDFYSDLLDIELPFYVSSCPGNIKNGCINVLESYEGEKPVIRPGKLTEKSGKLSMMAVEKGIDLCLANDADALVTAPISKEAVNRAGYHIPGHTEFLAERTGSENFMMMLVNDGLRVGLVSIHVPLSQVPALITEASLISNINIMNHTLERDFGIDDPKIAVLGLNPHAGDGGIIGNEEKEIIAPALKKAHSGGINVTGPHPADGFFGNRKYKAYDGILAIYHDQGLIPFKTLSFGSGVNFTAGLPIIRTSPDHGTAFDIAGKNLADPSSFAQAFNLAIKLAENRKLQYK